MKKIKYFDWFLLLLFLTSIIYFLVNFFNNNSKVNLQKENKTIIKWQNDSIIDLGLLQPDTTYTFTTKIYNSGTHQLYIQDIFTSCGCTKANFSKTKITPNDSASITGTIKTKKRKNDFVVVSFQSNTNQQKQSLYIKYATNF